MSTEKKYRFIVIDDHPFFRTGVINFLSAQSGFEFIGEFSETRHLLNFDTVLRPDFILLDLNIPGIDGRISCELLKKKYPKCKIIALTQYSNLHQKLKDAKFDGYIEKHDSERLLDAIEIILNGQTYFVSAFIDANPIRSDNQHLDKYLASSNVTKRELEIIRLVSEGFTNPEIASKLFLSEFTVKTHRKNFYQKTGIRKIPDLIAFVRDHQSDDK